jgi:hypothetical protein
MRKIWFALIFFAGGISHEIRNPVNCLCIVGRRSAAP